MPFTIQQLNENNTVGIAQLSLVLNPATAIFTETNWSGGSTDTGIINVENTSGVDVTYFVSADWYAGAGGTPQDARLLAERLEITVTADPGGVNEEELYSGTLAGLIQQPATGRTLTDAANEDVEFTLTLPDANATDLIQGMEIELDLVFVAVEV
jgi:hypothetical protein